MFKTTSVYKFNSLVELPAIVRTNYSLMKFGHDQATHELAVALANTIFDEHISTLMTRECVLIPSPYNFVPNAATILTRHVVDHLNEKLVQVNGHVVGTNTIQRRVTYTADYGKVNRETREQLLSQDRFYFNEEYLEGKFLIFIDDVKITGTHERRLEAEISRLNLNNDRVYAYIGTYTGSNAAIESELNHSTVVNAHDYVRHVCAKQHHVVVRSIKILLGTPREDLERAVDCIHFKTLKAIVAGAYGEGYHKIPSYQSNLEYIAHVANSSTA